MTWNRWSQLQVRKHCWDFIRVFSIGMYTWRVTFSSDLKERQTWAVESKYQANQCVQVKGVLDFWPLISEPRPFPKAAQTASDNALPPPPSACLPLSDITSNFMEEGLGLQSPPLRRVPRPVLTSEQPSWPGPGPVLAVAGAQALPAWSHGVSFTCCPPNTFAL